MAAIGQAVGVLAAFAMDFTATSPSAGSTPMHLILTAIAIRTIRTLTLTAPATAIPTAGSRSSRNAKAAALSGRGGFLGSRTFSMSIASFALTERAEHSGTAVTELYDIWSYQQTTMPC